MANDNTIARNKKAYHDYEVLEKFEAGIALLGTEVKSCRNRNVQLQDAHAYIEKGEVWLVNAHIALYEQGNRHNHEPKRRRKLLLHKREIRKMKQLTDEKGLTLIPLALFLKRGLVKASIGVCRGKTQGDKRETLKNKEHQRDMDRAMRQNRN